MSEIFYAMIIFPIFFLVTMSFIFSSSLDDLIQYETVMNCPFPVNSAVATLDIVQSPPQISYSLVYDNDTSSYHVTTFECQIDLLSSGASINTRVYTGSNNWYDITGRASGYMFYISESLEIIGLKIITFANMVWLFATAPAQVSGLSFFLYIEVVLFAFIGIGAFMVIRG